MNDSIKATLTQVKDKSGLRITLHLTQEQKDKYLLEKGTQPEGMIKLVVI